MARWIGMSGREATNHSGDAGGCVQSPSASPGEGSPQRVHEFEDVHRFGEIVPHSVLEGGGTDPFRAVTRDHDDRHAGLRGLDVVQHFEPGAVREPIVEHDGRDGLATQDAESLGYGGGVLHVIGVIQGESK